VKTIISIFFIMLIICNLMGDVNIGAGFDLPGNHIRDSYYSWLEPEETGTGAGSQLFAEILFNLPTSSILCFDVGIGSSVLFDRELDVREGRDQNFSFVPIYGFLQLGPKASDKPTIYIKPKLGYDVFMANENYRDDHKLEGGLYTGLGVGLVLSKGVFIEISYNAYTGGVKIPNKSTLEVEYTNISALLGIRIR